MRTHLLFRFLLLGGLLTAVPALAQPGNSTPARLAALEAAAAQQAQRTDALEAANGRQARRLRDLEAQVAALQAENATQTARITALEGALGAVATCGAGEAPVCCPQGESFCGNGCVALDTDAAHCGACGNVCGHGETCINGACGLACAVAADCGEAGNECNDGTCGCDGDAACGDNEVCRNGCTACGNGVVDDGEVCDDGNLEDGDRCANDCTAGQCAPDVVFAVGVFGTTTCAQNCRLAGGTCVGIGTDDQASNGLYNDCGDSNSGIATDTAAGTCETVLGGNGCSEYAYCACAPVTEVETAFAVGVFGTTTCDANCASVGGTCTGIGTDAGASNGLYYECGASNSGVASETAPGGCGTTLGGNGCSEYTTCQCAVPSALCTDTVFAVGVYGTATCASNCAAQGKTCVGIGTDQDGLNGQYFECGDRESGVATDTAAGTCATVLGGNGCSEYTTCRCY